MSNIEKDLLTNKTSCYIFDIDNCLADADHIIMTNKQAYEKQLEEYKENKILYEKALAVYEKSKDKGPAPVMPEEPTKYKETEANKFAKEYFLNHIMDCYSIPGTLDVFISLALSKKVILLTAREELFRQGTIEWLKRVIIERANEDTYRRIHFQLICKPNKYSKNDIEFKKEKVLEITKQYNIQLIIEDFPEIIEEYTKLGFLVLSPNREMLRI